MRTSSAPLAVNVDDPSNVRITSIAPLSDSASTLTLSYGNVCMVHPTIRADRSHPNCNIADPGKNVFSNELTSPSREYLLT